jgi:hypothetical protein
MNLTASSDSRLGPNEFRLESWLNRGRSTPSDSSLAHQRWEADGGACFPPSPPPFEIVTLPFSEYSAHFPNRIAALQAQLNAAPKNLVGRCLIVDVSRVQFQDDLLMNTLRVTASELLNQGRCLILIGKINKWVASTDLPDVCRMAENLESAMALCRDDGTNKN